MTPELEIPGRLRRIIKDVDQRGLLALVVGGFVRDSLLGLPSKDRDVEVYGVTYPALADLLSRYGKTDLVGKSFGVVKLYLDREEYDFSVPRQENKIGVGHQQFEATFDPGMTPQEAFARRDFTINAMGWDPIRKELHDYYGGQEDLRDRRLRATSPAFVEDPLRILRGMQFCARFCLSVDESVCQMARPMGEEYAFLAKERIADEWMKLATRGLEPGRALGYLQLTGWSRFYPEIQEVLGGWEERDEKPETVTQTARTMNAAAAIADRHRLQREDRAVLVFAALAAGFSGASASGAPAGGAGETAETFLRRIGIKRSIVERVPPLVEVLCARQTFQDGTTDASVRRLARRLHPASVSLLGRLLEAAGAEPASLAALLAAAAENCVLEGPPEALIRGQALLDRGCAPGPAVGALVREAYDAQCDAVFSDRSAALAWLEARLRSETIR